MQNIIMQGVQSSVASTVADPSPGRDLISQSQQPAKDIDQMNQKHSLIQRGKNTRDHKSGRQEEEETYQK